MCNTAPRTGVETVKTKKGGKEGKGKVGEKRAEEESRKNIKLSSAEEPRTR